MFSIFLQTLLCVENSLEEDKDRKLILTLINIEKHEQSDLFFGVLAILEVLAGTNCTNIAFSTK